MEYRRSSSELRLVKGRIDFSRYTNPSMYHIVPCEYFERDSENKINQILKYTSFLLFQISENRETSKLLQEALELLDSTELRPVQVEQIKEITFHRLNIEFKPFVKFCELFLRHSTLALQASNIETFSLLIPMELVFQDFIAHIISRHRSELGIDAEAKIQLQEYSDFLARSDDDRGIFALRPDVVISTPSKIVIDTKYKILNPNERKLGVSQSDMYQMYAYARRLSAKKVLLLYPNLENYEIDYHWYFKQGAATESEIYIRTIDLATDMSTREGWKKFLQDLRSIVHESGIASTIPFPNVST